MRCFPTLKGLLDHFETVLPWSWRTWEWPKPSPESGIQVTYISDVGLHRWTLTLSRDNGRLPLRQREAVLVDTRWKLNGRFPNPEDWDEAARRMVLRLASKEV